MAALPHSVPPSAVAARVRQRNRDEIVGRRDEPACRPAIRARRAGTGEVCGARVRTPTLHRRRRLVRRSSNGAVRIR